MRIAILVMALSATAFADERRAEVNYMLHCQGCHLPDAKGFEGRVPPIKDFAGWFLHSKAGRDFLIRVPGVAHAALADDEIAELMNWLLTTFSAAELPADFTPFTAAEVRTLRADPERDPDAARQSILAGIAADHPALRSSLPGS